MVLPPVTVVPWDPSWAAMAEAAMIEVRMALGNLIHQIEHIGSTAVPGLAAKPIIDLMASTDRLEDVSERGGALDEIAFAAHHNGMQDRLLFVRAAAGVRTHILHVVSTESWAIRNQRLLRDYLRGHPAAVKRYSHLKLQLAASSTTSADYTRAKTELIQELTDAARRERGWPGVPVWEKTS